MIKKFNKKFKNFSKYCTFNRQPFFKVVNKYLKDDSKLLDIGAGDGQFADCIKKEDIYLLDGNSESCKKLKNKYKNIFECKIPGRFPFENNFFDVIHCSHLIEHLEYKDAYSMLEEIDRILKPGGFIVISAPLLHAGFYNDFSHVKPYNPAVLLKYLTRGVQNSATGKLISKNYIKEELIYRYTFTQNSSIFALKDSKSTINKIFYFCHLLKKKIGFGVYERSGFTLVLKNNTEIHFLANKYE